MEITTDQRQQLALIINELLDNYAGKLPTKEVMSALQVKEALEDKDNKPESLNLLGKAWHATKTGTDIAKFVIEHPAEIASVSSAITAAVALLK